MRPTIALNIEEKMGNFKQRYKNWYMSLKIYQNFRIINKSAKAFVQNFFEIMKAAFAKRNRGAIYAAFCPEGEFGDILRQKAIMTEFCSAFPNTFIDVYNAKAMALLKDFKNIRLVFNNKDSIFITRKLYGIVFDINEDKFKLFVSKKNEKAYGKIKENLRLYQDKYPECFEGVKLNLCLEQDINFIVNLKNIPQNSVGYTSLFKILAGSDNETGNNLQMHYTQSPLEKFGITEELKYITVQCGQGSKGALGSKSYKLEKWDKVLALLKKSLDPKIKIVQVGLTKENLKNADICANSKTTMDELCSILSRSVLHLDIDGACTHICKTLGIRSVVLWWKTNIFFNHHPENVNIVPKNGDINSINPEDVVRKITEILPS
jgi:ADP-heptose:LPS heptosyltransferase